MAKITILGMGLIGTSIALALRRGKMGDVRLVGHDKEPTASATAAKRGAIDTVEYNIGKAVEGADMVIVATPVKAIKEILEQIAPQLADDCIVTDTGSTKQQVLKWAADILPRRVHFVGGHPMAGKEQSGPEAAGATLFDNAIWCIIPGRAAPWAVQAVVTMIEQTGAKPFFIDAGEHDSFVAAVSHLPLTLSSVLVSATTKSPAWHEMARLAAGGYRDVSRLASGDPEMNRDILLTNASEIAGWVDRAIADLVQLRGYLREGNEEGIARFFAHVY
ncbi:MAG: prephenate dehydrogenase/arogenate dehydrogenase family protein [Candidatus Wallbacteria bacterium]|nr:prephenate dehydrogenase/arogenate dehydrogenase family protein [Candidatus Wallbacteria bacterium]